MGSGSVDPSWGARTRSVHAGESPDPATGASAPPLVMSTTFLADPDLSFSAEDLGEETPFVYTRWGNPTVARLEAKLAALEGSEAALGFATGMAAAAALFAHELRAGDHLVMSDVAYAGVSELVQTFLPARGIETTRVDLSDLEAVAAALRPGRTRLVYAETPANPILRLCDLPALAELAHGAGSKLAVDSTFATPLSTRPLALGADWVLHSLSKYIGGHGDALGGAVLGPARAIAELRQGALIHLGGALSPFNAWLILRGAATLPLRMKAHSENAARLATFLESRPGIRRVIYPGLESHPQRALARRQMALPGGMLTFQTEADGHEVARRLAERLRVFHYAVSLGHHRSLVFHLSTRDLLRTSFPLDERQEASWRLFAGEGIFRVSVGIEDPDDLIADLDRALG